VTLSISLLITVFFISLFFQLVTIYLSYKYTLFIDSHANNEPQKFHQKETSRAGGIGILLGVIWGISFTIHTFTWVFIVTLLLAFLSGIFEDFHRSLSAKLRLLLQSIAAFVAVWFVGAVVVYLGLGITMPYWLGVLFSIFAIVGMMNAVNIIDGFNGLASGVVLLILCTLIIVALQVNNTMIVQTSFITIIAVLGFLIINFPKGYIFLGDGGAYLLVFITALLGIFLASQSESVSPWFILAIFIYPVWEVVFSMIRKKSIGRSPMEPDSYHLHMLIYRQVTQNNPLTSVLILLFIAPFIILHILYANNSLANIMTIILFIVLYLLVYYYLYKKDCSKH
jgi:UDP-N-acetylmuramyl pentapeptide phosphotransferase/UDP-N-acetylglucosamine-1-phosphate transferase